MRRDAAQFDAMRSIASNAVTATYANLGSALTKNALILGLHNGSDKLMIISLDGGTSDHIQLPAGTHKIVDLGGAGVAAASIQIAVKLNVAGAATAGALVTAEVINFESPSLI